MSSQSCSHAAPSNLNDSVVSVGTEDEGDDAEYNYLADQAEEEKEEEFRNDRGVKISSELRCGCSVWRVG